MRRRLGLLGAALGAALARPPAALAYQGWLPPNVNGAYGGKIDFLYTVILAIVGILFFATEGILLYSVFAFRARPGRKATCMHGSKKVEVLWSVGPGLILLWLAAYQMRTWNEVKRDFPPEAGSVVVQAFPRQFNWFFRYPGPSGTFGEALPNDDFTTGSLTIPLGQPVIVKMTSRDVIHSFFVPNARVKQDVVPGMLTRVWFRIDRYPCWNLARQESGEGFPLEFLAPEEFAQKRVALDGFEFEREKAGPTGVRHLRYKATAAPTCKILFQGSESDAPRQGPTAPAYVLHHYEIACAELCGLGHYRMREEMRVLPPDRFAAWAAAESQRQLARRPLELRKKSDRLFWTLWDKEFPHFNTPAPSPKP